MSATLDLNDLFPCHKAQHKDGSRTPSGVNRQSKLSSVRNVETPATVSASTQVVSAQALFIVIVIVIIIINHHHHPQLFGQEMRNRFASM